MTARPARAARLGAVLAAPLLALAAAPAAAQTQTASITSTPANGTHYVAGDAITARVTISAGIISVSGGTFAQARMSLDIGGATRQASPVEAISNPVGQLYVDFTYTVTVDDFDTDGVSIPANAVSGPTWGASGGGLIDRNNAALPAQADHKVIGSAASISSTSPALLNEHNINTADINVALTGVTFGSGVAASSFELVTTITGITVSSVSSVSSGDTSATLRLTLTTDISAATDLAVRVLASAHSGGTDLVTGAVNLAPVSTLDAGPGITTGTLAVAVAEGDSGFWTVDLNMNPGASCTAGVTISVASDNPAVTVSPATLTYTSTNWTTAQTVTATAVQDGNVVDETVTVSHTVTAPCPASGYTTGLAISSVTVTVDDDDTGIFSIDSPRVVEGDSGPTPMIFTVTLAPAASVQATVDYAYALSGSATSGVDHAAVTPSSGTLTFAPGETSKAITVTVNGDTDMEPDEGIGMQLRNPAPSGFALASGSGRLASGIIVDDDRPTLTIDSPRVAEGNSGTTEMTFTVTLSPASTGQVTVNYGDPGNGTAEHGRDYTAPAPGTLTFAAGETSKTIAVQVQGDSAIEPDETVWMSISNPVPSGTPIRDADGAIATSATGVGTIVNDDGIVDDDGRTSPPLPQLTIDAPQVVEGPSGTTATLRFTARLSRTTRRTVTVAYEDARQGTARAGALCERGADYVAFAPGTLTFAPGTRTQTIDVTVIGDAVEESDETVRVRLHSPVNADLWRSAANPALSAGVGAGTIVDDDPSARSWSLPLVVADSNPVETGFVRIVNRSDCAGVVAIHAIDDAGRRAGPVSLSLDANAAVQLNSRDLERGNASKGLSGGVGSGGAGPWRLELGTELDVEALAYVRTAEGFVTSVHESVAEGEAGSMRYRVPFFNPGSNRVQQSRLRLVNPGDGAAAVVITGRDDAGEPSGGEVRLTLAAGESRSLGAEALEEGGDGLDGGLGDGSGKWRLTVSADRPLRVMSLLRSPTGNLVNISSAGPEPEGGSPEPEGESPAARTWTLPLVVADADPVRTGLVRVVNRSDRAGAVAIHAIDDAGRRAGPVSLSLGANAAVTFNSHDLEEGNASKGLDGGVGSDGAGPWRLELRTALDVEALAYIRTAEGFVTSVHGSAAEEDVEEEAGSMRHSYRVPFFNPGSNRRQQSRLRLINLGDGAAEVVITGRDDAGESPGSEVRLTLAAGKARSLGAEALEEGGDGLDGSLGDGSGKWRLTVSADRPLRVMSLLRNPTGSLTNVSGAGPEPEVESRP